MDIQLTKPSTRFDAILELTWLVQARSCTLLEYHISSTAVVFSNKIRRLQELTIPWTFQSIWNSWCATWTQAHSHGTQMGRPTSDGTGARLWGPVLQQGVEWVPRAELGRRRDWNAHGTCPQWHAGLTGIPICSHKLQRH